MAAWPLILRELRELSRGGQLFWIRVIAAAVAFGTTAFLLLNRTFAGRDFGAQIFHVLNTVLFLTILAIGPLITSDCIAREKREGTLGLLLLAPLTARDIIFSKFAINAIRAFTLLLAVLPLMALPVVFGGVPAAQILLWIFRHILALSIALSAGMLASTLYREFIQAAVVAEVLCFSVVFFCGGFSRNLSLLGWPVGLLLAVFTIQYCSLILKERWEADSAGYTQPFWIRAFSTSDSWHEFFKWDTQKARSINPIAWLQEYSWSARLAKWGWCVFILFAQLFLISQGLISNKSHHTSQASLAAIVILGIALSGANSFRSERLSGAMELILVTPLTPLKIIAGRLWGIWVHFFPAIAILVFLWIASAPLLRTDPAQAYLALSCYVFLPMMGLFISMLPWHVLVAWAVIFLGGAFLPIYIGHLTLRATFQPSINLTITLQAIIGLAAAILLHHRLRTRSFVVS